jgi:hypothetical protein
MLFSKFIGQELKIQDNIGKMPIFAQNIGKQDRPLKYRIL